MIATLEFNLIQGSYSSNSLPSKRDKEVDDPSVVDERVKVDEEIEAA